jgi:hypothetical protein
MVGVLSVKSSSGVQPYSIASQKISRKIGSLAAPGPGSRIGEKQASRAAAQLPGRPRDCTFAATCT